mgnify:CR=1 FL=1
MEVLFPFNGKFVMADDVLSKNPDPKKAMYFVDLMKAEIIEKLAWSVHINWSGFYALNSLTLNDKIQIDDPNIENRVYNQIIKNGSCADD